MVDVKLRWFEIKRTKTAKTTIFQGEMKFEDGFSPLVRLLAERSPFATRVTFSTLCFQALWPVNTFGIAEKVN